jgi:hypothetical protein
MDYDTVLGLNRIASTFWLGAIFQLIEGPSAVESESYRSAPIPLLPSSKSLIAKEPLLALLETYLVFLDQVRDTVKIEFNIVPGSEGKDLLWN